MKWLLIFWAGPVLFLGTWYTLSYYDISFGTFFFSRQMHDLVFDIYGRILGIPPNEVPPLAFRAIVFDTGIVFGLIALRRHRELRAWWMRNRRAADHRSDDPEMTESLSNAP